MLSKSSEILERPMGASSTVEDMRRIVGEAVKARRDRGRSEAVFQAARELRLTPRRVLGILRAEVVRVWADELEAAREWEARYFARQSAALAAEAQRCAERAEALKDRCG